MQEDILKIHNHVSSVVLLTGHSHSEILGPSAPSIAGSAARRTRSSEWRRPLDLATMSRSAALSSVNKRTASRARLAGTDSCSADDAPREAVPCAISTRSTVLPWLA